MGGFEISLVLSQTCLQRVGFGGLNVRGRGLFCVVSGLYLGTALDTTASIPDSVDESQSGKWGRVLLQVFEVYVVLLRNIGECIII